MGRPKVINVMYAERNRRRTIRTMNMAVTTACRGVRSVRRQKQIADVGRISLIVINGIAVPGVWALISYG